VVVLPMRLLVLLGLLVQLLRRRRWWLTLLLELLELVVLLLLVLMLMLLLVLMMLLVLFLLLLLLLLKMIWCGRASAGAARGHACLCRPPRRIWLAVPEDGRESGTPFGTWDRGWEENREANKTSSRCRVRVKKYDVDNATRPGRSLRDGRGTRANLYMNSVAVHARHAVLGPNAGDEAD